VAEKCPGLLPLLAAHRINEVALVGSLLLAFMVFGCIASSGYLANDLLDLAADRRHPSKRFRPFAVGDLSLAYALATISRAPEPLLPDRQACIGPLPWSTPGLLPISLAYPFLLKKIVVLVVIILASLYSMQITRAWSR
jgi:4-hydroxybenzoate polyprenyltransferase